MKKNKLLLFLLIMPLTAISQVKDPEVLATSLRQMKNEARPGKVKEYLKQNPVSPVIVNDSVFSLYWLGKASKVYVAGDLQGGWSKPDEMKKISLGDTAFFYITYKVPADSRFDYQLIVDDRYIVDPRNPAVTPSGFGPHSQVAMPGFRSDPLMKYSDNIPHGRIDSLYLEPKDKALAARYVRIYLPSGVNEKAALLLVYDGFEAMKFENFPNVLDNLIATGDIKPVVAVFIPPVEREAESIGNKTVAFINMLCDELIPQMITKYGVSDDPSDHGITGISAGGHLALAAPVVRPEVIANGAGQSSTITRPLVKALQDLPPGSSDGLKLYIDVGRYDLPGNIIGKSFLESNREFAAEVGRKGIEYKFAEVNDGHSWANWRERTDDYLKFFWGKEK